MLEERDAKKVKDVAEDIFLWLQDRNWVGVQTISKLIVNNREYFKEAGKKSILKAFYSCDIDWLDNILVVLYGEKSDLRKWFKIIDIKGTYSYFDKQCVELIIDAYS